MGDKLSPIEVKIMKTTNCNKCKREIKNCNFSRHYEKCDGTFFTGPHKPIPEKFKDLFLKTEKNEYKCYICEQLFHSIKSIRSHIALKHFSYNKTVRKNSNFIPWNKGKTVKNNPELVDKLRAGGLKIKQMYKEGVYQPPITLYSCSEKGRKEQSERKKKLYRDNPEAHPNRKLANNRTKMTYPEKLIFDLLTRLNVEFEHNKKILSFYPDFTINKLIIEIDGEKWHDPESDEKRDEKISALGYKIYRFKVGNKKDLIDRVQKILIIENVINGV